MKSFDEYWVAHEFGDDKHIVSNQCIAENAFKAGAQSRQSEVDELKKRIDAAIKEIQDESWSDEYGDNQAPTFKLIKILKGENHES